MMNLSENETKAIRAICKDCDDIEGYGFTRIPDMVYALSVAFEEQMWRVGEFIRIMTEKNLIDIIYDENEVWVEPEVYKQFC